MDALGRLRALCPAWYVAFQRRDDYQNPKGERERDEALSRLKSSPAKG